MDQREKNIQISDSIDNAKKVAVIAGTTGGIDAFSAAAGLYFLLKDKQKDTDLVYQNSVPAEFSDLVTPEIVKNTAGVKEVVVSIDYSASPGAKAQYSTNNGILFIKLSPVVPDFDLSKVQVELQGQDYDLIFTVGIQNPEDLGKLYTDMKYSFSRAKVINVDIKESNQKYGMYNVIDSTEPLLSLLILNNSRFWRLKVTPRSARALLKGISHEVA